jgi:hypothetical protein
MSPQALSVEVCSGPNDGESICAQTGTFTVGSRGAADLPLAGEPDLPELARITATAEGGIASITADVDFEYNGKTGKSIEGVTLPVMIRIGGVDLSLSPSDEAVPISSPAAVAEVAPAPASGEVGPVCSDCGLVNAPGAARCDRCRRWLD